jgi:hypothetical protein
MQYSYDTTFDAPNAHFDKLCLFSDTQAKILEIQKVIIQNSEVNNV